MKRLTLRPLLALGLLAAASVAHAVDDGSEPPEEVRGSSDSVTFSGGGLSKISAGFDNVDDAINLDATIGFRIPNVPWFSIELALSQTVAGANINEIPQCTTTRQTGTNPITGQPINTTTTGDCPGKYSQTSDQQQFGVFSFGGFAVLRSTGSFYGMAKVGFRTVNSTLDEHQEKSGGNAYGVGIGYRWNPRSQSGAEIAFNKYGDLYDAIAFNFNYGFGGRD